VAIVLFHVFVIPEFKNQQIPEEVPIIASPCKEGDPGILDVLLLEESMRTGTRIK
jgi:hypothetical protein